MSSSKVQKQDFDLCETRSKNYVYLVGPVMSEAISGCKLPSIRTYFHYFFTFTEYQIKAFGKVLNV